MARFTAGLALCLDLRFGLLASAFFVLLGLVGFCGGFFEALAAFAALFFEGCLDGRLADFSASLARFSSLPWATAEESPPDFVSACVTALESDLFPDPATALFALAEITP
ncbi:MAG: hypothetical protein N0C84_24015, partial [Candidatus Thiodiazotropha taylori]|nr:hypothetical protein [Candidatus Thiodiazotropha taylori]MCW4259537.1 hypothetical protein [Candidatus Thiodiazotropha taylori]